MTGRIDLGLVATLALRSLWTHRVKTVIVGLLISFGTMLVVVGSAMLDSVEASMQRSIVSSLAGHVQVYSADAKDDLALFGSGMPGGEDVGQIRNVGEVKQAIGALPEVKAVVPMGIGNAMVIQPGELDRVLQKLRDAVYAKDADAIRTLQGQIRHLAKGMGAEAELAAEISSDKEGMAERESAIATATSDDFWADFDEDPLGHLEFLDTKLAPHSQDGRLLYLRYLGTDLDAFAANFDRFKVVEGELVPTGRHGMLLSKRFKEKALKHKVARVFDEIQEAYDLRGRNTTGAGPIEYDEKLADKAKRLPTQYRRITYELDADETAAVEEAFGTFMPEATGTFDKKMEAFLALNDENFAARHAFFYEHIAPKLELYAADVGDELTIRTATRGGYIKAVNVPVWGVFEFTGLERSDLAGAQNLVDLPTFRELYGVMTEARKAELEEIREVVGAEDVTAADAEDALFGGDDSLFDEGEDEDALAAIEALEAIDATGDDVKTWAESTFEPSEVDVGLALNAAIVFEDGVDFDKTYAKIVKTIGDEGLNLKAADWQTAAGFLGQFLWVIRAVLYVAIFIIFTVALFIINNSMVIATMERVAEIGTLRAIGAQKRFVLVMFLAETLVLGFISGVIGAGGGAGLIAWMGQVGLPAGGQDILVLLFSGPRLYPTVGAIHLLFGLVLLVFVSLASTLYPALLAIRVQPVVAMGTKG